MSEINDRFASEESSFFLSQHNKLHEKISVRDNTLIEWCFEFSEFLIIDEEILILNWF
jgi:hypothetical protein